MTVAIDQTKNQITPGGESEHYVPDGKRQMFQIDDLTFGIVICHEGWRYPETVRWAATRGAQIVFQPQVTGGDDRGRVLEHWGESFYEMAMVCRAQENSVYFASVNQAMRYQNSATSLIDRGIEQGLLGAHPKSGACMWCDFKAVCGPHEESRIRRKAPGHFADLEALRSRP